MRFGQQGIGGVVRSSGRPGISLTGYPLTTARLRTLPGAIGREPFPLQLRGELRIPSPSPACIRTHSTLIGRRMPATRVSSVQMAEAQPGQLNFVPDNFTFSFTCPYETAFGERICLVGSLPEMGSWKLENAVELQWNEGHLWKLEFPLPRERSNFEFKVVVVSDKGGSRWEQGANRVVEVTPELLEAPLDCVVDFWLEFEKTDASRAKVLVYPESVQGPMEISKARLELQDTRRARLQEALSRIGGTPQAKELEDELSVFEADCTSLQGKVEELKALLGDQSYEAGNMVALPTEAGKVSLPSLLTGSLPPLAQTNLGSQPSYSDYYGAPDDPSGLNGFTDPSELPYAAHGNGGGSDPSAKALAALQLQQQEEAEERVRALEAEHRKQMEIVQALAEAEQREAEWQETVQEQLAQAQLRQAQKQREREQQQEQAAPVSSSGSSAGLEGLAAWISSQYMGMGKSAADALPELRRRGIVCTGRNLFSMPNQSAQLDADELAQVLRLQARTPSRPSTPMPSRPPAPAAASASALSSYSPPRSSAGLEELADFIATNYMGMGKSAADALPELRRRGVVPAGRGLYSFEGSTMRAHDIAARMRLQARTPSQPVSPSSSRPVSPSSVARAAPRAAMRGASPPRASPAGSRSVSPSRAFDSELGALAAWISEKYTGMGKSPAEALPELRRQGIMSSGWNLFTVPGHPEQVDADGVAKALRLRARPDSRSVSPTRSASPIRTPTQGDRLQAMDPMEDLASFISSNFMGMGKSAADALPELRRAGVTASGSSFSLGGKLMGAPEIAQVLRLQARTPSRPSTPMPSRPASSLPSKAPASFSAPSSGPASSASGLEGLAAWISTNYMGMGKSAMDALPELRRAGVTASGSSFSLGGQVMSPDGIAQALRLQARTSSRPSTPMPTRPASASAPAAPSSYSAPSGYPAPSAPAAASSSSAAGLENLAAWISSNYMGMGKSAADALPELRRRGIMSLGGGNFSIAGSTMDAAGIAQALRLQVRTPSRQTSPMSSRSGSPASARAPSSASSAPASYSAPAPAASSGSASGLEGLAAWISTNYMGMGKSAADALPDLRRKGITASGSNFSMGGQILDAAGIAQALRLQARTPSRPTSPMSSRPTSPLPQASYSAPTPAATSSGNPSGLEGLAAWISTNYMGMGKSAADALPELRRAGVTASGSSFSMGGRQMGPSDIAQALRLQARPASRPVSPIRSAPPPTSTASPMQAASASSQPAPGMSSAASGLEGLANFIASNYEGMGKSAADVLPELRRKGIVAGGSNSYSIQGRKLQMSGPEVADLLRLKVRLGSNSVVAALKSRASSPQASFSPSDSTGRHRVAAPEIAEAGTRWLAAFVAEKYVGMGKTEAEAYPELKRRGVVCTSVRGGQQLFEMPGQPTELSATEVASLLKLRLR